MKTLPLLTNSEVVTLINSRRVTTKYDFVVTGELLLQPDKLGRVVYRKMRSKDGARTKALGILRTKWVLQSPRRRQCAIQCLLEPCLAKDKRIFSGYHTFEACLENGFLTLLRVHVGTIC